MAADAGSPPAGKSLLAAMDSPVLLRGDADTSYRDPAALYVNGEFHLFYTYNRPDPDGKVYWYTATSRSRDLKHWSAPRLLTPKDQSRNYSSPGNVIRFGGEWVMCLQTYPIPNFKRADKVRSGDATARLFLMRSRDLETWSPPDRDEPGKWWCFFKQNGASRSWSRDLKTWTFAGHFAAGENACVIRDREDYVLFHSPPNGIGVKRSRDLIHWQDEALLTLGQKDWPWAQGRLTAGFVLDLRRDPATGKALMFFHGSEFAETSNRGGFFNHASLGLAWSDDLKHWDWPGKVAKKGQ